MLDYFVSQSCVRLPNLSSVLQFLLPTDRVLVARIVADDDDELVDLVAFHRRVDDGDDDYYSVLDCDYSYYLVPLILLWMLGPLPETDFWKANEALPSLT